MRSLEPRPRVYQLSNFYFIFFCLFLHLLFHRLFFIFLFFFYKWKKKEALGTARCCRLFFFSFASLVSSSTRPQLSFFSFLPYASPRAIARGHGSQTTFTNKILCSFPLRLFTLHVYMFMLVLLYMYIFLFCMALLLFLLLPCTISSSLRE